MTDYREINELQRHPARARGLAQFLLKLADIEWTEWELDFLGHIGSVDDDLSTRQAEKLVELRDASLWHETVDGLSLKLLIDNCFLLQHELGERDGEFIRRLKQSGLKKLRRRDASRLLRCARTVGEIEPYQGRTLDPPKVEEAA